MTNLTVGQRLAGTTVVGRLPGVSRGVHSNEEARRAGLRGGIVVNEFHFSQMSEFLIEVFGDAWLTRGEIDIQYLSPLYDGDALTPLAVVSGVKSDGQIELDIWCENQAGTRLAVGTASCVPASGPRASSTRERS